MTSSRKLATLLPLALAVLGGAGCHHQKVQAAAPPSAPQAGSSSPPAPAPQTATPTTPDPKPPAITEAPPVNPRPETPAPKPVTPRAHVNPAPPVNPTSEPPPAPRPAPPQIRPRLSPAQTAEYRRKTTEATAEADKNLQGAYGRQLNESQRDLVEKVRGFLAQARQAIDASDWERAFNLAEKARLLSVELVNSL